LTALSAYALDWLSNEEEKQHDRSPLILQRNLFYSLRQFLRFGLSKGQSIFKITRKSAEIKLLVLKIMGKYRKALKDSLLIGADMLSHLQTIPSSLCRKEKVSMKDRYRDTNGRRGAI
jgi:hypothetical protein